MISFSIAPKLLALYLLLILSITADDSIFTDPPLGQQAAVGFSPSVTDTDDAIMNQPVIQNEADLQRLSGGLTENTKSFLLSDGETVNCADSPHAHKRLSRSSEPFSKRQQNDFCSPRDDEKLRLVPPSYKPGASDIPAGPQDDTGFQRSRGSMGGANEFFPDPLPDMKKTQRYGKPNRAMCPNTRTRVPVCSPFDQKITSPAGSLVPCRFCMCFLFFFVNFSPFPTIISLGLVSQKSFPLGDS